MSSLQPRLTKKLIPSFSGCHEFRYILNMSIIQIPPTAALFDGCCQRRRIRSADLRTFILSIHLLSDNVLRTEKNHINHVTDSLFYSKNSRDPEKTLPVWERPRDRPGRREPSLIKTGCIPADCPERKTSGLRSISASFVKYTKPFICRYLRFFR